MMFTALRILPVKHLLPYALFEAILFFTILLLWELADNHAYYFLFTLKHRLRVAATAEQGRWAHPFPFDEKDAKILAK
jgi:hypothetical protein